MTTAPDLDPYLLPLPTPASPVVAPHLATSLHARLNSRYGDPVWQAAEGYASRSRDGIHDLIDLETARATADTLAALHDDLENGGGISGPAARRVIRAAATAPLFRGVPITLDSARKLPGTPPASTIASPAAATSPEPASRPASSASAPPPLKPRPRTSPAGRRAAEGHRRPVPGSSRQARPDQDHHREGRRMTTPASDERERIRAAMDRILAGAPERSNGALALEAAVPRNALTQRHTDLKNEFYQRIKERGTDNGDEARLRATIARLRKTIEGKNKELAQLRVDVPALVRTINQLTMENRQLRDASAAGGSVVPFPGHAPPRPRD